MKTYLILLKLRRAGYEFVREVETERNYLLRRGNDSLTVPKREEVTKQIAAAILHEAGLLLTVVMLAALSVLTPPAGRVDPGHALSSSAHWTQ